MKRVNLEAWRTDAIESDVTAHLPSTRGHWYAWKLVRMWGGQVLDVPAVVGPEHPLSVALGCFGAGCLSAAFGGTQLAVPVSLSRS